MIGGPVLRQHVVEFIRGTGVKTDGVVDATSTNGPWTWTVPSGVTELFVDACGAGQSGGAGAYQTSALSAGGGAGGCNGAAMLNFRAPVVSGASLTITLGAGGTGSASANGASNSGGTTSIAGLLPNRGAIAGTVTLRGGDQYIGTDPTSSTSAVTTQGQGNGTAGADGAQGTTNTEGLLNATFIQVFFPSQGGGGKASAAAGASGGYTPYSYILYVANIFSGLSSWFTASSGTTSGGGSWGGGGRGFPSIFSNVSPAGGNGDAVGTDAAASDYGAGGGGGGGSGTARRRGGDGGPGYARFVYWRAD